MPQTTDRLRGYLDDRHVEYRRFRHMPDFTAQETAAHTGTPGRDFADHVGPARLDFTVAPGRR